MNSGFEDIVLTPEQTQFLATLVEAARTPTSERQPFRIFYGDDKAALSHPALRGHCDVYVPDLLDLENKGLVRVTRQGRYGPEEFDVTPEGLRYYAWAKQIMAKPVEGIQAEMRQYLQSDKFTAKYPAAYDRWLRAEAKLWGSDSEKQFTEIGHLCRETMQEFAAALVEAHNPPDIDPDKTHARRRLEAVLRLHAKSLGEREKELLDALLVYWEAVDGLAQRQEHDSRKEGKPLVWEDGRRLVFQLMVVMYEIDSAISRLPG